MKRFRMPTAYTILFLLIVLVAAATWLIPAGRYERLDGVPVPGTYQSVEPRGWVPSPRRPSPASTTRWTSASLS